MPFHPPTKTITTHPPSLTWADNGHTNAGKRETFIFIPPHTPHIPAKIRPGIMIISIFLPSSNKRRYPERGSNAKAPV